MPNWTREHDAHIARECEGLEVSTCKQAFQRAGVNNDHWAEEIEREQGNHWVLGADAEWIPLYDYTTDANARDRAVEAWRIQEKARWYTFISAAVGVASGDMVQTAQCIKGWKAVGKHKGKHALLWALYRATGGAK